MALATPNIVKSPLTSALNNKINPSPLGVPQGFKPATAGVGPQGTSAVTPTAQPQGLAPRQPAQLYPQGIKPPATSQMGPQGYSPATANTGPQGLIKPPTPIPGLEGGAPLVNGQIGGVAPVATNQATQQPPPPPASTGTAGYVNPNPDFASQQKTAPSQIITANTPQNQPPTFPGLVSGIAGSAQGAPAVSNRAQDITDYYRGLINPALKSAQGQEIGNKTTGTSPVGEGNAAAIAASTGQYIQGLTSQENQELAGVGEQLTGQQQQTTGLTAAGGLVQPQANFPFVFDPNTGTFKAPGVGGSTSGSSASSGAPSLTYNPQQDAQSLAKAVMNHQIGYNDAIKALSYGGNGVNASGQLSAAILSAGGNPTTLQGQSDVQVQQAQQVEAYKSAMQQGQHLQSQLGDLITTFGLNPTDINAVNAGIQKIAQNTSSPQYQILSNYINEVANTYSQVLTPPGGSATDTTRSIATGMLNATANGQSIISVMKALDDQAQAKISGIPTLNSTGSSTSGNFTEGQTTSSGGYNFVYQNGQWVAK